MLIYCIEIRNVQVIHIRKNNLDVKVQVGRDSCLSTLLDDWWVSFFLLLCVSGKEKSQGGCSDYGSAVQGADVSSWNAL